MYRKASPGVVFRLVFLGAALTAQASGQTAPQPKTENAKVEQRSVTGSFAQTVDGWAKSASRAQWLGYAVPAVSGDRQICCSNGNWNSNDGGCGPCRLEGSDHGTNINLRGDTVKLEGPRSL